MKKIKDTPIKKSDLYPKLWCLVHDRKKVITLVPPGNKVWAGPNHTMFVGTKKELKNKVRKFEKVTLWKHIKAKIHNRFRGVK